MVNSVPSGQVDTWENFPGGAPWQENLTEMEVLTEDSLYGEIARQYKAGRMYSYVGEILCALNPFSLLGTKEDNICSPHVMERYTGMPDRDAFPPHIWATADMAFQAMLMHAKNQVCAVSGESGAGKTECAKLFTKQIVNCSQGSEFEGLEDKLLEVNPILEAFGNSQTAMNKNSSRFGRFTQIMFSKEGAIRGATITEYLLEKSRVCSQGAGEQNFHMLYILFAYAKKHPKYHELLAVGDPADYPYLTANPEIFDHIDELISGGKGTVAEVSADEIDHCLEVLGFSDDEAEDIFQILAAVLKFSKLDFDMNDNDEAIFKSDAAILQEICKQLGADPANVESALLVKVQTVRGATFEKHYSASDAKSLADATAKTTYQNLFHYIIVNTNKKLSASGRDTTSLAMGVLDIFGFEDFGRNGGDAFNSIEQLCINLANEQLQFFFTEHIFGQEIKAYEEEGISGADIKYEDNQPCLNMIMGKGNLFAMLDEQAKRATNTDQSFTDMCCNALPAKFGKVFEKPRMDGLEFSIVHYAGKIKYNTAGWLLKNKDELPDEINASLRISTNSIVAIIFGGEEGAGVSAKKAKEKSASESADRMKKSMKSAKAGGAKKMTLAKGFKASLVDLMVNLNAAEPHFVRCLKPNQTKEFGVVEEEYTKRQLRYTGMLDTTRIRREGYPQRPNFGDFLERYKIIGHPMSKQIAPTGPNCAEILKHAGVDGAKVGKTKIFMKYFHADKLNDKLKPFSGAAMHIGKFGKGYLSRLRYRDLLKEKRAQDAVVNPFLARITSAAAAASTSLAASTAEDSKFPKEWADRIAAEEAKKAAAEAATKKAADDLAAAKAAGDANAIAAAEAEAAKAAAATNDAVAAQAKAKGTEANTEAVAAISAHKNGRKAKKGPTKEEMISWYQDQGDEAGAGQTEDGRFQAWFHGIISRKDSEKLIKKEQDGTFLIRVAESRFGYSLTMIWSGRVKHFAIDVDDKGMHIIRGNRRKYKYLNQIVVFHKTHSITDAGDRLLAPCNPGGSRDDLLELVSDD